MVAEDNASVRKLAVAILVERGYTVIAADSGQACLRQLRQALGLAAVETG